MEIEDYSFILKLVFLLISVLLTLLGYYQVLKRKNLRNGFRTYGFDIPYWKRYNKRDRR